MYYNISELVSSQDKSWDDFTGMKAGIHYLYHPSMSRLQSYSQKWGNFINHSLLTSLYQWCLEPLTHALICPPKTQGNLWDSAFPMLQQGCSWKAKCWLVKCLEPNGSTHTHYIHRISSVNGRDFMLQKGTRALSPSRTWARHSSYLWGMAVRSREGCAVQFGANGKSEASHASG